MRGVLIVTHGELGAALLQTLRHILGEVPAIEAVPLAEEDSIEKLQEKIDGALKRVDPHNEGTLVCVDMLGGTPFNAACRLLGEKKIHVLTGLSLPMLLKALSHRDLDIQKLAKEVQQGAREAVRAVGPEGVL